MPRLTVQQKWELWALRNLDRRDLIKSSIRDRWALPDWNANFPWWREPSQVRILMYADELISFVDGIFGGLTYVKTLLESRAYFHVNFEITTAHRNGGPTGATLPGPRQLTDPELDILNKFDEIWFFGFNTTPDLDPAELKLLDDFMKAPKCGGVLVTGDHENRGKGIAGDIARAGKMRLYPSPKSEPGVWNNSLEEGSDPNETFDPDDQSDEVPQTITYERFPAWSLPGFKQFHRPHPVLCSPDGPIDVLPDHQHEGEAIAPMIEPDDDEWPKKNNHQELPVVIATGKTKEPDSGNRTFGVLSAYNGHKVDVGRIVADSSWHHWFDFNLTGIPESEFYRGFNVTAAGQEALKKIDAYFLNCGVWLAPPERQREMRHAAWWSILWTSQIAELFPDAPLWHLGEQAIGALTRHGSICAVSDWVLDSAIKQQFSKTDLGEVTERSSLFNLSLEEYVAGGIVKALMTEVGPFNPAMRFPYEAPPDNVLELAINKGTAEALSSIESQLETEASRLLTVIAKNFRPD